MGNGNKVEFLVAICALITSIMAVYMAWDQGRVMRAQQHGMVHPVLHIEGASANTDTYSSISLTVINSGVGPAIIESVVVEIDGKEVTSPGEILRSLPPPASDSSASLAGRALAPGQFTEALRVRWNRDDVDPKDIAELALSSSDWAMKICYCSVFQRCWETDRIGTGRARPVEACTPADTDIFANFGSRLANEYFSAPQTVPAPNTDTDAPETE